MNRKLQDLSANYVPSSRPTSTNCVSPRNVYFVFFSLLFLSLLTPVTSYAQLVFSRFDFNAMPLTLASIGPNGVSADPDGSSNSSEALVAANCEGTKGIDLTADNSSGIYNQPSLGMAFRFNKFESRSDFFVRGGTSFYQDGGMLYVSFRTSDGASGYTDYGPFNTGFSLPFDYTMHEYTFVYTASTGSAVVSVDGDVQWSMTGPPNRPLYWTGDPYPVIATVMDGTCTGPGFLDYAYFFIPDEPLPVEFLSFEAQATDGNAILNWETADENPAQAFLIERSFDGHTFSKIAEVAADAHSGNHLFTYVDPQPGTGQIFFRIRQQDAQGLFATSETRQVTIDALSKPSIHLWPNPSDGQLQVQAPAIKGSAELSIMDPTGLTLYRQPISAGNTQIDLTQLPAGLYLVQYQDSQTRSTQKLLLR